jgi:hypothetical protein
MSKIKGTLSKIGFENRGHCVVSDDERFVYIPIAKNASSFTEYILMHNFNWHYDNFLTNKELKKKEMLVLIRDPLERWMSGVVEHFYRKNNPSDTPVRLNNDALLCYVFNQCALDEHSELQVNFLNGLNSDNCTFIRVNDNYTDSFKSFVQHRLGKKLTLWNTDLESRYNRNTDSPVKLVLLTYLKKYYNRDKQAKKNVSNYLQPDYDFMTGIDFYDKIKSGI